jgi:hypothetical protein
VFRKQHDPVGGTDVVEHDVVVSPHLSDEQKRDGVGEIGRPERDKAMQQVLVVSRWPDLENEQRYGDGEDAIAERLQPHGVAGHRAGVGARLACRRSRHPEPHSRAARTAPSVSAFKSCGGCCEKSSDA